MDDVVLSRAPNKKLESLDQAVAGSMEPETRRERRGRTLEGDRARQAIVVSTLAPTGARMKA